MRYGALLVMLAAGLGLAGCGGPSKPLTTTNSNQSANSTVMLDPPLSVPPGFNAPPLETAAATPQQEAGGDQAAPSQPTLGQMTMSQPTLAQTTLSQPTLGQTAGGQSALSQPTLGQTAGGQSTLGQPNLGPPPLGQTAGGQPAGPVGAGPAAGLGPTRLRAHPVAERADAGGAGLPPGGRRQRRQSEHPGGNRCRESDGDGSRPGGQAGLRTQHALGQWRRGGDPAHAARHARHPLLIAKARESGASDEFEGPWPRLSPAMRHATALAFASGTG